jgi:hypothetical protein
MSMGLSVPGWAQQGVQSTVRLEGLQGFQRPGIINRETRIQRLPSGLRFNDEDEQPTSEDEDSDRYHRSPRFPHSEIQRQQIATYDRLFFPVGTASQRTDSRLGGLRADVPNLASLNLNYRLPLAAARSVNTNAEIRVGCFYYDVTSVSTSWLYSDNVDRAEANTRDGLIGIFTLNGVAMIQLLDNLRLAAQVGLVYLPLRGEVGLAGFMTDSTSARLFLGDSEHLRAQLSYDLQVGDWNVLVYDEVRSTQALFTERFNPRVGESFDEEDRAGRYAFRSTGSGGNFRVNERGQNNRTPFSYINNRAGFAVDRLVPTETRVGFGAYHLNYWYLNNSQGNTSQANAPTTRDVGFFTLNSERESLRFKPFASYQVRRTGEQKWDQEIRTGLAGPITENLNFYGTVGYFIGGNTDQNRFLAGASVRHQIGPLTSQSIDYRREVTEPEQDLEESYSYHLRQTLGPRLIGDAFVSYATFEDLDGNKTGTTEWRGGVLFTSALSTRSSLRFGAIDARVKYDNSNLGEWDRWSAAAQLRHRFSEAWEAILSYQYQTRNSTVTGDSYDENLIMLTVTRYFNATARQPEPTEP